MREIDLTETYLLLGAGPDLSVLPVDDRFWATIDDRDDIRSGRLVMAAETDADWDSWEMHPDGDEIILVSSGSVRVHLDPPVDGASTVVVTAPNLVVMPAGTWHTMDVIEPARVLTITWGAGTRSRPR